MASSLVWLPVILLSAYLSDPPPAHPLPSAVAAVAGRDGVGRRRGAPGPTAVAAPDRHRRAGRVRCRFHGRGTAAGRRCWGSASSRWWRRAPGCPARRRWRCSSARLSGWRSCCRDAQPTAVAITLLGLAGVLLLGMGRRESVRRAEQRELQLVNAARVQEEHARAAALAERARIARDVHDVLAHSLSALAVQLQGARLMLLRDGAPADTVAQIERAQHLASEGLAEARRAVTALRTSPVDLADGLRALVADTPDATLEIDGVADAVRHRAGDRAPHRAGGVDERAATRRGRPGLGAPAPPRRRHRAGGPRPRGRAPARRRRAATVWSGWPSAPRWPGRTCPRDRWRTDGECCCACPAPGSARRRPDDRARGPGHAARAAAGHRGGRGRARRGARGGARRRARPGRAAHRPAHARVRRRRGDPAGAHRAPRDRGGRAHDLRRRRVGRRGAAGRGGGLALQGRRRRGHRPGAALGRRRAHHGGLGRARPAARRRARRRGRPRCPTGSPRARPRCWGSSRRGCRTPRSPGGWW